ncbi:MAG TPA: hypothetical protein VLS89_06225, partial [Candidatus Nanopelagicales bacterium]|nr:hypothetical protein [Candidatus Nanopelagicales bacterium]
MNLAIELQRRLACSLLRVPAPALRALAGPERRSPEGYVLDPQVQLVLRISDLLGSTGWDQHQLAEARALMDSSCRILAARPTAMLSIRERRIPVDGGSVRARLYIPEPRG